MPYLLSIAEMFKVSVLDYIDDAHEIFDHGYEYVDDYDQITILLFGAIDFRIIFYDSYVVISQAVKKKPPSYRYEYADPNFQDQLIAKMRELMHL